MRNFYRGLASLMLTVHFCQLSATDFFLEAGTGAITSAANWNTQANGLGTSPSNFSGTHTWHLTNRSAATLGSSWANGMSSSAIIVIENGFNLTYNSFGACAGVMEIASGGSLTLGKANNLAFGTIDPNGTIVFNHANAQVTSGLSYGNVVIAVSTILTGGQIDIFGTLTINAARTLSLSGQLLALNGTNGSIAGTGEIFGDNSSGIGFFGGNGANNGTLRLATGGETLSILYLQFSTGQDFFTLDDDVFIENNGAFNQQLGSIDLNGHRLTIDNTSDISFVSAQSDGVIMGTSTSELVINALTIGSLNSNTMFMDASSSDLGVLILNSPQSLVVSSGLTINDSLSVLDGTFDTGNLVTILSPAGGPKARVSRIGGNGVIQGNLTAQTVISGGSTGWNLLGSPVDGQTVASWDTYATNGGTSGLPMTCNNCFYAPSALSPSFASIQGWDEVNDAYDDQVDAADPLTSGTGFWVYVGDGSINTNDMTLINSGPVLQGVQAFGLSTGGNGWNLMANPYPSPISWSKTFDETDALFSGSIDAEVHVFSADVGYGTYVANVGGTNGMLDILGMGQGFYVLANPGAVSLVFDEVVKMDDQSTEIWKSSASKSENTNREYIKLTISGAYGKDETMINFDNRATTTYDSRYDGHKIFTSAGYQGYGNSYSQYTTLSTKDAVGTDYAVNSLPLRTNSLTIQMLARVMVTGSHTISVSDRVNFESCLILHDKLLGKYHDLNAGPYVFDISDTTSTPRFELIMCQSESGPVMSVNELQKKEQVFINQDAQGAFVRTSFEQRTKATISAFNIVGQQVMSDVTVDGTETMTRLNLSNMSNQVVIIRVTSDNETTVKKIVVH